jgi:hypothetical protein
LLDALPVDEITRLHGRLERVALPLGMTVYEANAPISHVYFPLSGIVSMVSALREGTVEVGTIGC